MSESSKPQITAIILAGGQGSRFNNRDKGWIEWQGKPFVKHLIERLNPQVSDIIINCNRNLSDYQALGYTVCQDQLGDFQGPLAGLQAALAKVQTPLALVCPVDSPLLPENLGELLYHPMLEQQADIAFPNDGERSHYLPVLLKTDLLDSLNLYLQGDERRVRRWYMQHQAIEVDLSAYAAAFKNINSEQNLQELNTTLP